MLDARVPGWLSIALFASNALALLGQAYRAFSQHRALIGLPAGALAFSGIARWVVLQSLRAHRP